MSNEKNLFSIIDTGTNVHIKCEGDALDISRAFTALLKSSYVFRAIVKTSLAMAEEDVETNLLEVSHKESIIPNKTQGDA
jgi:hypothetical protein